MSTPEAAQLLTSRFSPLKLETTLTLKGGYHSKPVVLETLEVDDNDCTQVFVLVNKKCEWLLKSAVGSKAQNGSLKRSTVIDDMKKKVSEHWQTRFEPAVAAEDDVDPMQELAAVSADDDSPGSQVKRKLGYEGKLKRASRKIISLTMPAVAASAFPSASETRVIRVFPKGTNQLWLHRDDVPWLVEYVALEVASGGVVQETDPVAVATSNCAAPGVHIRWDFQSGDGWEALFLEGAHKGTSVLSRVSSLTEAKWDKVRSVLGRDGQDALPPPVVFSESTLEQRKAAAWTLLEQHCVDLLGGTDDGLSTALGGAGC